MVEKKSLLNFSVVLIEPKNPGNVGAVARAMMNFDIKQLYLVNPCPLDTVCYARAMHATDILDSARTYTSLQEVAKDLDFLVATSSIDSKSEKHHLRSPVLLQEFTEKLGEVKGNIGLVFGREDYGLFNEEIAVCDIMLKIPTSQSYPSLNLSHAVAVVLYAIYSKKECASKRRRQIGSLENEKLHEFFGSLLDEIDYPAHKKQRTRIMFKRIMGRAMISRWEYHTLMGVLSRTLGKMKRLRRDKKP